MKFWRKITGKLEKEEMQEEINILYSKLIAEVKTKKEIIEKCRYYRQNNNYNNMSIALNEIEELAKKQAQ